jgi:hypothetical protein
MNSKKENLTTTLLAKDVIEKNKTALDIVNLHGKVSDIIERTHIAMGRKSSYKIAISSTKDQKLNTKACATTH